MYIRKHRQSYSTKHICMRNFVKWDMGKSIPHSSDETPCCQTQQSTILECRVSGPCAWRVVKRSASSPTDQCDVTKRQTVEPGSWFTFPVIYKIAWHTCTYNDRQIVDSLLYFRWLFYMFGDESLTKQLNPNNQYSLPWKYVGNYSHSWRWNHSVETLTCYFHEITFHAVLCF